VESLTLRKKLLWISIFYFAQGMPFGVVLDVLPVYFRQHGVSLSEIGMMGTLTLPWTIKVLWAPLLDRFGERRTWVTICCFAMALAMFCVPLLSASSPGPLLWALLIAFTVSSATQDVAIDAFSIGVAAKGEEGKINSLRAGLYRVGVIVSGGATMYLVAPLGWTWVFLGLSLSFIVMAIGALAAPKVEVVHQPPKEWAQTLLAFLRRPGSIAIFAFVLIYRMDYVAVGPMIKPFWIDRGMTPAEIGTISTSAGMALGILGAALGGLFTSRFGIFHGLWLLGITQALPNLGYAAVAQYSLGRPYLYAVSMAESFGGGLATAAFLSFLMRISDKRQAATQYALLTALYALPRFVLAPVSGKIADLWGYPTFFFYTFLLAVPSYALLPWVYRWIGSNDRHGAQPNPTAEHEAGDDARSDLTPEPAGASGATATGRRASALVQ
jgi:MFS transporter, PAT family, beta-lactamase induction signal transducer AmpG